VLRNNASGPEIGLPGRISAGFWSGKPQNWLALRPAFGGSILNLSKLKSGGTPARKADFRPTSASKDGGDPPNTKDEHCVHILCYTMVLPGRSSSIRISDGFWSGKYQNQNRSSGQPSAGRRAGFEAFPNQTRPKLARKPDFRPGSTIA
jgi:hypothetical protein